MRKMSILNSWWKKISKKYGQAILIAIIVLLSGWLGYRIGEIKAENNVPIQMSINNLDNANQTQEKINTALEALKRQGVDLKLNETTETTHKDCLFVASRKSRKYHTANCKYGKNIKPGNRVCFKTQEEAKAKGFVPAKGCIK